MANKNFLFVLPLLTLLSVSPSELLKKEASRSLASIEVEEIIEEQPEVKEEKKFERFQAMISQVDSSNLLVSESITKESIKEKSQGLQLKIQESLSTFNKEANDKEEIAQQRESIESLVIDKVILDKEVDVLEQKQELDEELKKELSLMSESQKEGLEQLIVSLEKNEELLDIPAPEIADSEVEVIEDDKTEETDKEEPRIAAEDEAVEDKKDEIKEEKKEEVCQASEQVKVLTSQVEKLMEEQNLILQAMLNLTKVMVNMSQNMQQSQQPYFPMPQTAYQYHAPMSQGNWVYYPQGFNPQMNQSFYPNQAQGQQQNNWNLQPSQNLQFAPQGQLPQIQVGQFGMEQQAPMNSFNFSSNKMPLIGMN